MFIEDLDILMSDNFGGRYTPASADHNLLNGVCTLLRYDEKKDEFLG